MQQQAAAGENTGSQSKFLVFGARGQTGRHFVSLALREGHAVRALVRNPAKVTVGSPLLETYTGSINDFEDLDELLAGVDFVVAMLGDAKLQAKQTINAAFIKKLVPAMRRLCGIQLPNHQG